ncbi:MAG: fibronectin type III domain-containing protein [Clostridia bacterium]|nr:fibronectin type III domain-containing protein [Clostridia bacterium]
MKRMVFSFIIVLLLVVSYSSVSGLNGTDGFSFTDTTVTDNGSFSAEISLTGDVDAKYIEFTLVFPDGISVNSFDVADDFKNCCDLIDENGGYRFVLSSDKGISFGEGKTLIRLYMTADDSVPDGKYRVKAENIRIVDIGMAVHVPDFYGGHIVIGRNTSVTLPETDKNCSHRFDGWTVISQPDYDKTGKRVKVCDVCGQVCKTLIIPAVPRRSVADTEISFRKNCTYTGKALKPKVSVSYKGIPLEKGTDYTVSYKNNKSAGTGKITVKGIGTYEGNVVLSFNIKPKSTSITKIKKYKNDSVKIDWKKVSRCDGYRIYVRYPGEDKYTLLKTVKDSSITSYTTKNLKTDGKYRFKICTYVSEGESRIISAYSKIKVFRL